MEHAEDLINKMIIKIIKTLKMPLHVSILRSSSGKVNYFIKSFGYAAAYRLYVYMLCLLQGGRSTDFNKMNYLEALLPN
jgi:hypothetical protein